MTDGAVQEERAAFFLWIVSMERPTALVWGIWKTIFHFTDV